MGEDSEDGHPAWPAKAREGGWEGRGTSLPSPGSQANPKGEIKAGGICLLSAPSLTRLAPLPGPLLLPEPWPAGASHSPAFFLIQIKTPVPSTQFSDSQTAPKKHLGNEAMPQPHPQRFWFCCPREGPGNRGSKKHSRWFEHAPGLGTTSKADSGWRLKTFDWISSHQGCRKLTGTYQQVSVEFRAAF